MVIDSSALIAILCDESTASRLAMSIDQSDVRMISAATVLEASLVLLSRYGAEGEIQLDSFLRDIKADIIPFDEQQIAAARDAARVFGRSRHRAALNFGDCFSYALATVRGEPLLFVGEDFALTDVRVAEW